MWRQLIYVSVIGFCFIAPSLLEAAPSKSSAIEFTNAVIKERCAGDGGEWTMFADGCADTCYRLERENVSCPRVFRSSCDCGESKCWDTGAVACVPNETVIKKKEKE